MLVQTMSLTSCGKAVMSWKASSALAESSATFRVYLAMSCTEQRARVWTRPSALIQGLTLSNSLYLVKRCTGAIM